MVYEKQNFTNGQILTAEQLNQIEDGIMALIETVNSLENNTSSDSTIKYVESTDTSNLLNLRDFESGTYVLYGKFHPYSGSSTVLTFSSSLLVSIVTKTAGTHVQVFYPVNNCVQFLSITDDSYERTNVYLNDLLTTVSELETSVEALLGVQNSIQLLDTATGVTYTLTVVDGVLTMSLESEE